MQAERLGTEPYSELGKLLDSLARRQNVRGPYNIARYVEEVTGYAASGQAVSKCLYGKSLPKQEFIEAFANTFGLALQERSELAWVYTYGSQPYGQRIYRRDSDESIPKTATGNRNGGEIGN